MFYSTSLGSFGLKGKKKTDPTELQKIGEQLAKRLHPVGLHKIDVRCYTGLRPVRSILWGLGRNGVKVRKVFDFNRLPHGHVRLKSRRRIKRRKR